MPETPAMSIFESKYNVTVSSTPLSLIEFGFTVQELRMARYAHITVETAGIRYGFGFHAINADVGKQVAAGDDVTIEGTQNILNLKLVADSSDASVSVDIAR
jgi:hypothetical protein